MKVFKKCRESSGGEGSTRLPVKRKALHEPPCVPAARTRRSSPIPNPTPYHPMPLLPVAVCSGEKLAEEVGRDTLSWWPGLWASWPH